jgi:hypothetical protein
LSPHPSKLIPKAKKSEKAHLADGTDIPDDDSLEYAGQASTFRSHGYPLSDHWICNSGASTHMTLRDDWVYGKVVDVRKVKLANGSIIFSSH